MSTSHASLKLKFPGLRGLALLVGVTAVLSTGSALIPQTNSRLLGVAAPQAAHANAFTDYMGCITGVGVPAGVGYILWPARWAIARGWSGGPGANAAVTYYARRYANAVRGSCMRFIRS